MVTPIRIDRRSSRRKRVLLLCVPILLCFAVSAVVALVFLRSVDLKPQVGEDFFFSKSDPRVRADNQISRTFPEMTEIDFTVGGDIASPWYADHIRRLSDELLSVHGVTGVVSLNPGPKSHGPKDLDDALKSPLWTDILVGKDHRSTDVIATVKDNVGAETITRLQELQRRFDRPGFRVVISGLPYTTELISRTLAGDMRTFSLAAICVFGVVLLAIFRSLWVLLGTFLACANSSAATLIITQRLHIPIGPVTANVSTMVFVMTLSPLVYLTFNWKRIREQQESAGDTAVW